ncbi:apotyrosinase chaperone MelC1 [Streptomyces spectabilis]|uniref:Tyrosinase n=1 Tax=Streptomyces spectabilis TaxID=68270 RepID=A0A516R876_STRST|nr:tyrosinase cofactor [Streptomyces spectabilis]QDQ11824.1 tyrosinase [Streptomyces spectabilis]
MSGITRRQAIGAASAAAGAVVVGVSAAHASAAPRATRPAEPASFDEVYLGRRIQGGPAGGHGGHHADHGGGYSVRVDGDELHIMRNADGTWISVINHYDPQATPRALARAAVDDLQGAALVPLVPATR